MSKGHDQISLRLFPEVNRYPIFCQSKTGQHHNRRTNQFQYPVTITFPRLAHISRTSLNERDGAAENEDITSLLSFRSRHKVVLVDDEESIRLAVGDYLYDSGYQATAYSDADALLEHWREGKDGLSSVLPDLIVR